MAQRRLYALMILPTLLMGCAEEPTLAGSGSWRVVNYWAIWCTPCREEIPELNRLSERGDITVLGVNFDAKRGEALTEDSMDLGIEFPTIDDPSGLLGIARPDKLPTTLVIDPDGNLVSTLVGPQTEEGLERIIANFQTKKRRPIGRRIRPLKSGDGQFVSI